jgi:hypothetical protein
MRIVLVVLSLLLLHGGDAFYMVTPNMSANRRSVLKAGGGGIFGLPFFGGKDANAANAATDTPRKPHASKGPTNEVVKVVHGMKRRRLGGSDIFVSELGLGTSARTSTPLPPRRARTR